MDKPPFSVKQMDCRMISCSRCTRMIRGESGCSRSGLAYFKDGRFVAVNGVPSTEVYSITGDKAGNLWLSGNQGLSHLRDGRLVEHFPWSALGRHQQAKVIVFDREQGGMWLSFWKDGGVEYFKDGQVRASVHRR